MASPAPPGAEGDSQSQETSSVETSTLLTSAVTVSPYDSASQGEEDDRSSQALGVLDRVDAAAARAALGDECNVLETTSSCTADAHGSELFTTGPSDVVLITQSPAVLRDHVAVNSYGYSDDDGSDAVQEAISHLRSKQASVELADGAERVEPTVHDDSAPAVLQFPPAGEAAAVRSKQASMDLAEGAESVEPTVCDDPAPAVLQLLPAGEAAACSSGMTSPDDDNGAATAAILAEEGRCLRLPSPVPLPAHVTALWVGEQGQSEQARAPQGISIMGTLYSIADSIVETVFVDRTYTTDPKLADRVTQMLAQKKDIRELLCVAIKLRSCLAEFSASQSRLAGIFDAATERKDELGNELDAGVLTLRHAACNGRKLCSVMDAFCDRLDQLVNVQIREVESQLSVYHAVRAEYDAGRWREKSCRAQLEACPDDSLRRARHEEELKNSALLKQRYSTARQNLTVLVHFLEKNEVTVLSGRLVMLNNASVAYFTGNTNELDKCMQQFGVRMNPALAHGGACATEASSSAALTPLPVPTAGELGAPSEALTALLARDELGYTLDDVVQDSTSA